MIGRRGGRQGRGQKSSGQQFSRKISGGYGKGARRPKCGEFAWKRALRGKKEGLQSLWRQLLPGLRRGRRGTK